MSGGERPTYTGPTTRAGLQAIIWGMRADLEALVAEAGPGRLGQPGAMGAWTVKDCIAHLAAWRWWSVARLDGAARGVEPEPPWPPELDEERPGDVDRINDIFYAAAAARPADEVLRDSRATLDRLEATVLALPDADLFDPNRFPWLHGYPAAAIITSSAIHLEEHRGPALTALRGGG